MTVRRRARMSLQTIFLLIHGTAWLLTMAVVAVASDNHVPPSELWTALPLGISAILVAFRTSGSTDRHPPRHKRETED